LLLKRSQQRPLIIVVEDLHWIDKSSEDFLVYLIDSLASASILLLATYRPGYRPPWGDKSYLTQIALPRLTPSDSLTVVQSILRKKTFPHSLAQIILEKTDGNPLFLEELTQAIIKHGDMRTGATVPDTLQGVLMARIDRLPDGTKRLLQTAAVLGRSVPMHLLRAIWQESDDLDAGLQELRRQEFLHLEHAGAEPTYTFKHALVQEAAYESLLMSRRRLLHTAVGQALEQLYAGRLEAAYDRLAYHYSKAEQAEQAVTYLSCFAEKAGRDHAHVEAVMALQDAIAHGERLPSNSARERLLLDLHLRLAVSLHALGRDQEALEHLLAQQPHLDAIQDATLDGQYALLQSQIHTTLGDWEQAAQSAQLAVDAATQGGDEATLGQAYHVLAMERYWMGYPVQGAEYSQRAIALLERAGKPERLGMAHFVWGLNALILGDFASALAAVARVRHLGETLGDAHLQTFASWLSGWLYATQGEWDAGMAACQQALATSSDPLNTAFALGWLGYAHVEKGEANAAIPLLEQAVLRMRQSGYHRLEGAYTIFLGEAQLLRGHLDIARDLAFRGLTLVSEEKYRAGVGWAQRTLGRIALAEGALAEAETRLQDALATFISMQARFEMGRTHLALSELAEVQDHRERVAVHLTEAYHLFKTLHVPPYVTYTEQRAHELGLSFSVPSPHHA
jgi:tetratricopeptide (TPR) repeat protein